MAKGPLTFWTHLYPAIYTCVLYNSTWVPWPCGNFGGEHLPQKTLLGIIFLFAQDGQNHAVVLLYKWASGQWFQCTFNYLYKFSFCQRWFVCLCLCIPWANQMVWMLSLQCFGHILELNQMLLDVKTVLHYFSLSIRCCLCWYLIWKSLQTALGSSARSGWQRTRWTCLWTWWSILVFVFGEWHALALHSPPLISFIIMSLAHIHSILCTEKMTRIPDAIMPLEKVVCFDREPMAMQNLVILGLRTCCDDFGMNTKHMERAP